jgi:Oxidoreductase molybdopterin binding domain
MLNLLAAAVLHIAITAATLQGLPNRTISATDEHGNTAQYSGVALSDVLRQQGVPTGEAIRGAVMTRCVVVEASDGYKVVFSLSELDPGMTDRVVLIADTRDGAPFSAQEGPYRLIVPGEKRGARWVRQVTSVDVEDAP